MNTDDEIKLRTIELTEDGLGLFAEATSRLHQDRRLCAFRINGEGICFVPPNGVNQFLSRNPKARRADPWDGQVNWTDSPTRQCRDMMQRLLEVARQGPIMFGPVREQSH